MTLNVVETAIVAMGLAEPKLAEPAKAGGPAWI